MRVETTRDDINMGNSTQSVFDAGSNKMCLHGHQTHLVQENGQQGKAYCIYLQLMVGTK
jgi:hypothetical protein